MARWCDIVHGGARRDANSSSGDLGIFLALECLFVRQPDTSGRIPKTMDTNTKQFAEVVKKLLVVPDKLLTAQLSLRPLSHSDLITDPTESIHAIADACDLMHSALADVVEVARNLADMAGSHEAASAFQRVGPDNYYRRLP